MTSIKKIEANRQNALKSTGPKTLEGKAAVGKNAIRHGLLSRRTLVPGENEQQLERLSVAFRADLQPVGALEEWLVDDAVSLCWRLRRLGRVEAGIFVSQEEETALMAKLADAKLEEHEPARNAKHRTLIFGRTFMNDEHAFGTLNRYEQQMRRALQRTLHELERRQARRMGYTVAPPGAVDVTVDGKLVADD